MFIGDEWTPIDHPRPLGNGQHMPGIKFWGFSRSGAAVCERIDSRFLFLECLMFIRYEWQTKFIKDVFHVFLCRTLANNPPPGTTVISIFWVRFCQWFPLETLDGDLLQELPLYIIYLCYFMFMNVHGICVLERIKLDLHVRFYALSPWDNE